MGLSFAGPHAPPPRHPRLLQTAGRYLLAATLACALTAFSASAMFLTTGPAWLSYLVEPFSLLLIPGLFLEGLPNNPYFFSARGVAYISAALYFLLFSRLLRRKSRAL